MHLMPQETQSTRNKKSIYLALQMGMKLRLKGQSWKQKFGIKAGRLDDLSE